MKDSAETRLDELLATETDPVERARLLTLQELYPIFTGLHERFGGDDELLGVTYGIVQSLLALAGTRNVKLIHDMLDHAVGQHDE